MNLLSQFLRKFVLIHLPVLIRYYMKGMSQVRKCHHPNKPQYHDECRANWGLSYSTAKIRLLKSRSFKGILYSFCCCQLKNVFSAFFCKFFPRYKMCTMSFIHKVVACNDVQPKSTTFEGYWNRENASWKWITSLLRNFFSIKKQKKLSYFIVHSFFIHSTIHSVGVVYIQGEATEMDTPHISWERYLGFSAVPKKSS